ncbi:hypothetical protein PHMEG_00013261 [Phytophthora megakarya]|uniref:Uncharacterized protein n=1 Tax=Phytophthora megakarya TaxID=4795 RepID=A0A225W874_9STRA|nr:hypothetical protein PHMEG_00013261 [Phytophthora megakarya]
MPYVFSSCSNMNSLKIHPDALLQQLKYLAMNFVNWSHGQLWKSKDSPFEYRLAVVHDQQPGGVTRKLVKEQFSIQDRGLKGILMKLSRNNTFTRRALELPDNYVPHQEISRTPNDRTTTMRKHSKIPQGVLQHLCLKSIFTQGCPSMTPGQCTQPFLTHFTLVNLHPAVKIYVEERFGVAICGFNGICSIHIQPRILVGVVGVGLPGATFTDGNYSIQAWTICGLAKTEQNAAYVIILSGCSTVTIN